MTTPSLYIARRALALLALGLVAAGGCTNTHEPTDAPPSIAGDWTAEEFWFRLDLHLIESPTLDGGSPGYSLSGTATAFETASGKTTLLTVSGYNVGSVTADPILVTFSDASVASRLTYGQFRGRFVGDQMLMGLLSTANATAVGPFAQSGGASMILKRAPRG
jgi:hypothetical protein